MARWYRRSLKKTGEWRMGLVRKRLLKEITIQKRIKLLEEKRRLEEIKFQAKMDFYNRALNFLRKQV